MSFCQRGGVAGAHHVLICTTAKAGANPQQVAILRRWHVTQRADPQVHELRLWGKEEIDLSYRWTS